MQIAVENKCIPMSFIKEKDPTQLPGLKEITFSILNGHESINGFALEIDGTLLYKEYLDDPKIRNNINHLTWTQIGKEDFENKVIFYDSNFVTDRVDRVFAGVYALTFKRCPRIRSTDVIAMRILYPNLRSLTIIDNEIEDNAIIEIALQFNEQLRALSLEKCPKLTTQIYLPSMNIVKI